jgi:response regulator RpfG family c-di-GMP phosphodiesterase
MRIRKILFVDDDSRVLEAFKRMMRKLGREWVSDFALSADEAWAKIQREVPDAVVSDLNMPGKTGADLLRSVRGEAATQFLPFILLTGNNESKQRMDCLESGATDYLNKPCDFSELVVRLKNALTLKDFQDEVRRQNEILEQKVRERTLELESSRKEVIFRLACAAELRDSATGFHILRVGLLARLVAEELGYDRKFQDDLLLASTLHDIGKLGIADAILLKPGRLTTEEYKAMQSHCRIGAEVLRSDLHSTFSLLSGDPNGSNGLLELAAEIAETHHEKWDGTGYPERLCGEEIPVAGRIVAVADVFDALCSTRPYKEAMKYDEALKVIQEGRGGHFDPAAVDALTRRFGDAVKIMDEHSDSQLKEKKVAA